MPARRWLRRPGRRVLVLAVTVAASLSPVAACASAPAAPPPASPVPRAAAPRLYADPANSLFAAAAQLAGHDPVEAAELTAIAKTPAGFWAAGQPGEMQMITQVTRAAARDHSVPVIVAYNLPDRDACGKFSAGRAMKAPGYEHWIGQLAAAVGRGDDIVIVEPDGLADILRHCLSAAQSRQRYLLLRYAMKVLGALPHARVYLNAGNPGLFKNPLVLTGPRERPAYSTGADSPPTSRTSSGPGPSSHGASSWRATSPARPKPVIDTSRNGHGPYTGRDYPRWCNPPGRALARRRNSTGGPGSTAICGSRTRAPATGPATAGLPQAGTGPSTRRRWPVRATVISGTAAAPSPAPRYPAPGAALLYAVLALVAAPRCDGAAAAERPPRWTAAAWAALWLGGAVLQLWRRARRTGPERGGPGRTGRPLTIGGRARGSCRR